MNSELWEAANGLLALLGIIIVAIVVVHLLRNIRRTYDEPVRFITLAFAAVIVGHTIKDGAAYLVRCCSVNTPPSVIIVAVVLVGLGKMGCIKLWSDPRWGYWPWVFAAVLVAGFLILNAMI